MRLDIMARKDEIVRVLAQEERAILDKIDEEIALEQTFVNTFCNFILSLK